jgi:hypothetical protein
VKIPARNRFTWFGKYHLILSKGLIYKKQTIEVYSIFFTNTMSRYSLWNDEYLYKYIKRYRVISGTIHFSGEDSLNKLDSVQHYSMNLWKNIEHFRILLIEINTKTYSGAVTRPKIAARSIMRV